MLEVGYNAQMYVNLFAIFQLSFKVFLYYIVMQIRTDQHLPYKKAGKITNNS